MGSDAAEALRQAVHAIYGPSPEARQHANQWLHTFSSQPAAWAAAVEVLDPAAPAEVAFFTANLLLNKVRTQWHQLTEQEREQLSVTFR